MGTCKNCQRSGVFLSISKDGLCKSCEPMVVLDARQKFRIIKESEELIKQSKNLDTKLSRLKTIEELLTGLSKYEEKGIPTIMPPPSQCLSEISIRNDSFIVQTLWDEKEVAIKQSKLVTAKQAVNQFMKLLLRIQNYSAKLANKRALDEVEGQVKLALHSIQLNQYLGEAKKAEFKEQYKKALDGYYEALYFLKNDDIDDQLQSDNIQRLEEKVMEINIILGNYPASYAGHNNKSNAVQTANPIQLKQETKRNPR